MKTRYGSIGTWHGLTCGIRHDLILGWAAFLCILPMLAASAESVPIPFLIATDTVTGTDLQTLGVGLGHPDTRVTSAYGLARHPDPQATRLLVTALPNFSRVTDAAVVIPLLQALGERGDPQATKAVVPYLAHPKSAVAEAAGWAVLNLERHQAAPRLKALAQRRDRFTALLREADLLFAEEAIRLGKYAVAERIYRPLFARNQPPAVRLVAVSGLAATLGDRAPAFLIAALADDDASVRRSAARRLESLPPGAADGAFIAELPKSPDEVAVALLGVLATRGAVSARPAVRLAATAQSTQVRIAATRALGALGDDSDLMLLGVAAASEDTDEATAAREALRDLPSPSVDPALAKALHASAEFFSRGDLSHGEPSAHVELIRAAAARRTPGIAEALRRMSLSTRPEIAAAAADALGVVGTAGDITPLLTALAAAAPESDTVRTAAEKAVVAISGRVGDRAVTGPPVLIALRDAPPPIRPAIFRMLAAIGGDEARKPVLKAASMDSDRDGAVRALAAWRDPSPASDLLALVPKLPEGALPVIALRGAIKLAGLEGDLTSGQRLALLDKALALATRDEERRAAIAAYGRLDDPQAWDRVQPFTTKPGFEAEAAGAAAKIADSIKATHPEAARAAATAALAAQSDEVRKSANETLKVLDAGRDYLGAWVVSQPFTKDAAKPEELHAFVFPPETSPKMANWKQIDLSGTGKHPYAIPLGDAVGGENRVAYLRTRIFIPKALSASLELGADDGVKAWLNGIKIVDDFALRAMEPGQVKQVIALNKGWNDLLLKITQGEGDWEACARLQLPGGSSIPSLKSERP